MLASSGDAPPTLRKSRVTSFFTVATVPTGAKSSVSSGPWGVSRTAQARRAVLEPMG